jgi:O-antigen/teichoic acid export membrane protein
MRQLSDNCALLVSILLPSIVGIFMLRTEIVHLLIAKPFQEVTLAILPLAALAGAVRNFRAHVGDQVFLLHNRTRLMVVVSSIDAAVTVVCSIAFIWYWGLIGAVIASVVSAFAAATTSFAIGFTKFGLTLPFTHLSRIALSIFAMVATLRVLTEATNYRAMAMHIIVGAAVYLATLAILYAPSLLKMLRPMPQQSST